MTHVDRTFATQWLLRSASYATYYQCFHTFIRRQLFCYYSFELWETTVLAYEIIENMSGYVTEVQYDYDLRTTFGTDWSTSHSFPVQWCIIRKMVHRLQQVWRLGGMRYRSCEKFWLHFFTICMGNKIAGSRC